MRAVADAGREMRDRRRADLDSRHPIGNFRADLEDDRHATTVGVMPLLAVDGPPALTALPEPERSRQSPSGSANT